MFRNYFRDRAERKRVFRNLITVALARKLEEEGELVLTRSLSAELSAPRREVFYAACELALREQIHILSGNNGVVRLLTNTRFEQETREYASSYTTARLGLPSYEDLSIEPLSVTGPESEILFVDDLAILEPISGESAWSRQETSGSDSARLPSRVKPAGFIVASGKEGRGILPDGRKTLPSRERDPWDGFDEVEYFEKNDTKKNKKASSTSQHPPII